MDAEERDSLLRTAQEQAVEFARQQFAETGISLFVWDAYARCRSSGTPVPEWVSEHFDEIARRLGSLVDKSRSGSLSKDPRAETIAAFGMSTKGRVSVFARFSGSWLDDWEWATLGEMVAAYVRKGTMIKRAIASVVLDLAAEHRLPAAGTDRWIRFQAKGAALPSEDAVRFAWLRYKAAFPSKSQKPVSRQKKG